MGVDVRDLIRVRTGLLKGELDGANSSIALGVVCCDVVRVCGDAAASDLGIDLGAACERVLFGLKHERRSTLTHNEAIAIDVVGARGGLGRIVSLRQGLHRVERGDRDGVDRSLRTAGDHDVSKACLQVLKGVVNRLGARCARRGHSARVGAGLKVHRDSCRRSVRHQHRNGQRHDAARAALAQGVPRVEQRPDTTNASGPVDTETLRSDFGRSSVGKCFHCSNEGELARRIESLRDRACKHLAGLDACLAGEFHCQIVFLYPVVVESAHARLAGEQGLPALGCSATEG